MNATTQPNGIPTIADLSCRTTEALRDFAAKLGDRFIATNHGTFNAALFDSLAEERAYTVETLTRIAFVMKSRRNSTQN